MKWGVHGGWGWGWWWEMACSRRDILHFPVPSVVFSNFEGKREKRRAVCSRTHHPACRAFFTSPPLKPSSSPPASSLFFFFLTCSDWWEVRPWQGATTGRPRVGRGSLSLSLVTQINKAENVTFAACADRCHPPQHQEVRQKVHLVIEPYYFHPYAEAFVKYTA